MNFVWDSYFFLAKDLLDRASNTAFEEACYRACASKAYYAMFNRTLLCLKPEKSFDGVSSKHQALIFYLINECKKQGASKLGQNLLKLKNHREKADYTHAEIKNPLNFAKVAFSQAERVSGDIQTVFNSQ